MYSGAGFVLLEAIYWITYWITADENLKIGPGPYTNLLSSRSIEKN